MQTHTLINTALILIYVCWFMWKTTGMLNSLISKLQVIEDKLDKSNTIINIESKRKKLEEDLKKRRD